MTSRNALKPYLVSQYEMMQEVYSHPDAFGKERLLKIRTAFESYDKDGSGTLDRNEIQDLVRLHWRELGNVKEPT
jgi:Ca2+-binding EF-hand superfamily protein